MGKKKKKKGRRRLPRHVRQNVLFNKVRRLDLAYQQGWLCYYCEREMTQHGVYCGRKLTLEHLVSRVVGGVKRSDRAYQVAACFRCNEAKGCRTEEDFVSEWEGRWDEMPDARDCRKCDYG